MIRAAGILILSSKGNALFLKRGPGGDAPGLWCVPGGRIEEGEKALQAAVRETDEETGGFKADPKALKIWSRTITPRETTGAPPTAAPGESQAEVIALTPPPSLPGEAAVVPGEEVEFTTFVLEGVTEFIPDVAASGEHVAFAWAPIGQPPEPLHPGVRMALDRAGMNELDVARAIRDGRLTSPQKYENVWLFNIRITGTGQAYRFKHKEHVWRDPSIYLNEDFVARCNGLPVILEHPPGNMLTSKEYGDRNVGSVFVPYISGEEVWAVVKVWDEPAALMMEADQLSTSPAVVWKDASVNTEAVVDGQKFFIEGEPSLLDHIAICRQGVWDRDGGPTGVSLVRGDEDMTAEEMKAELARIAKENEERHAKLMETMTGLTTVLSAVGDSVKTVKARMDAEDEEKDKERKDSARGRSDSFKFGARKDGEDDDDFKKRMDAEEDKLRCDMEEAGETAEVAKDKAKGRRDAAEEEDKKRADSARRDEDDEEKKKEKAAADARADAVDDIRGRLEALTRAVAGRTPEDLNAFSAVQARADEILMSRGDRARAPLLGESLTAYRLHFAQLCQGDSPTWKESDLKLVAAAGDSVFIPIADQIMADALKAAKSPAAVKPGTLRMDSRTDGVGHTINEFYGSPSAWMNPIAGTVKQAAKRFKNDGALV